MKIAIIGTGRVGSTTAFCLANHTKITELLLINRNQKNAIGLKSDIVGTYPEHGDKIKVGNFPDANDADIILITCGSFGAPAGSSLWDVSKPIIESIFSKIHPKKDSKIVVIMTPCDRAAHLICKLSGLDPKNIIGFGGQLDVNRLKYMLFSETNNFSKKIDANFIGEHGKRGIPVFMEPVPDREKIVEHTKNYFGTYLAEYKASTYGTGKELAKLTEALMSEKDTVLTASYYEPKYGLFVTWPCSINKDGVKEPLDLKLNEEEQSEFDNLIKLRKNEEG
ncbi:MAG: hypothetical protein KAJ91_00980 [Candidatus Aenigmarchaeota archaeon]|nr:hypothetical protein [Candidatus Aenigmarchaeota archaeon]MCK5334475.1 hypothetical protein [Candidatus Aenigmarchaeota archaeon]